MSAPLVAIVAMADNGVIGRGNELPWHLPDDLRRFKTLTMGRAVLMGRKTYDWAVQYQEKTGAKSVFDKNVANYVFSRKPPKVTASGVEFVTQPMETFVQPFVP